MSDLQISNLLQQADHTLLSYEFFPPKDLKGFKLLEKKATLLLDTHPDFVTCTWGAGGSSQERTLDVCDMLHALGFSPIMPHLTCVGLSKEKLIQIADDFYQRGYRNIMTLRGDPPKGERAFTPCPDGLSYADELVSLLKNVHPEFCCGVAGYPEKHIEAPTLDGDILNLKKKIRAGGDFITTQLFFDNTFFFDWGQRCSKAGIHVPIIAGLLPAMSLHQVQRFTALCGSSFPQALGEAMEAVGGEGEAAEEVGIEWLGAQIESLIARHVPGIHLYVLNKTHVALAPRIQKCFDGLRG